MPANWKTQQWPQDWKRAIFIPIPRKAMPNSIQIILQLHSFHMISRLCSKSLKLSFSRTWTENFQIFRLDSEKADDQIANIHWIIEKAREFQKKSTFASSTLLKPLTVWIRANYEIFLKRWEYQTTLPASWETCTQVKKQQLDLNMEQWTGSKFGEKCFKAVYCHPAYLTCMQSTSW